MSRRITKTTKRDLARTKELDIYELEVIDYDGAVLLTNRGDSLGPLFVVVDKENINPCCPKCGAIGEKHQWYEKTYKDCCQKENGDFVNCKVRHIFLKYICYKHTPNAVFQKQYDFADSNYNVTRRLENRAVFLAMRDSVSAVPSYINNVLTKQSVSEIVSRWIDAADTERGVFPDTNKLIIMSCTVASEGYAFVASDAFGGLKILDVVYFSSTSDIVEELKRFDLSRVKIIVSDVNPTIREAVHSYVSENIDVIIDIAAMRDWIQVIIHDALKKYAKQIDTKLKDDLVAVSTKVDGSWMGKRRDEALLKRPKLNKMYSHIRLLRELLNSNEEVVEEGLYQWSHGVPEEVRDDLKDLSSAIDYSFEEIINFYRRRTAVTEDTYRKIKALQNRLQYWKACKNHNLMRARVLYSTFVDNREELSEDQWYGVNYDDVMDSINKLIQGE